VQGAVLEFDSDCLGLDETVPRIVPETRPKQPLWSQRKPTRSVGKVKLGEGFTRKINDGREADFRLANRRFRPLSHLTAGEKAEYKRVRDLRARRPSPQLSLKLSLPVPQNPL
jgi:hypothetical protein